MKYTKNIFCSLLWMTGGYQPPRHIIRARKRWVDVNDVAEMAALSLLHPGIHGGQTYRKGYDARSCYEIAELMTKITGKSFQYQPLDPAVFCRR